MSTLTDAIKTVLDATFADMHTAIPGKVTQYDYTKQQAEVQPVITRLYNDDTTEPIPVISNVPVMFPRTKNAIIHLPLEKGDTGLIILSETSLEKWLSLGGVADPGDRRWFDLSDAVFVPGLYSFNTTSPADNNEDFIAQYKGTGLRIKKNGDIEVGGASFLKLINENFKDMFNNHVHVFTDIVYPAATPSPAVTGKPANILGTGIVDPGINPMIVPALPVAITNNEMTSKVKAQ